MELSENKLYDFKHFWSCLYEFTICCYPMDPNGTLNKYDFKEIRVRADTISPSLKITLIISSTNIS